MLTDKLIKKSTKITRIYKCFSNKIEVQLPIAKTFELLFGSTIIATYIRLSQNLVFRFSFTNNARIQNFISGKSIEVWGSHEHSK